MKGTIADSITIKVGHGIMTIPRNIKKLKNKSTSSEPEGSGQNDSELSSQINMYKSKREI